MAKILIHSLSKNLGRKLCPEGSSCWHGGPATSLVAVMASLSGQVSPINIAPTLHTPKLTHLSHRPILFPLTSRIRTPARISHLVNSGANILRRSESEP